MTGDLASFMAQWMPFATTIGVEPVAAAAGEVRMRLGWAPERCTGGGVLHGGALMALADSAGAWCAFLNLPEGASTTTIESKTNFLRAARTDVMAVSAPLHVGRTVVVVDTEIRDADDRLVARVTQTQAVLAPR